MNSRLTYVIEDQLEDGTWVFWSNYTSLVEATREMQGLQHKFSERTFRLIKRETIEDVIYV